MIPDKEFKEMQEACGIILATRQDVYNFAMLASVHMPALIAEVLRLRGKLAEYEREPEIDISVWPEGIQRQVRKVLALGRRMVR